MAAMAAPTMIPTLEITQPDDDMEISSDAGRAYNHHDLDNDIDLDVIDYQEGDQDIDLMLEDSRSEQGQSTDQALPDSGKDDIMYDEFDETTFVEDTMHDDETVPDEHLTDASDIRDNIAFDQAIDQQSYDVNHATQPDLLDDFDTFEDQFIAGPEAIRDPTGHQQEPVADDPSSTAAETHPVQEPHESENVPEATEGELPPQTSEQEVQSVAQGEDLQNDNLASDLAFSETAIPESYSSKGTPPAEHEPAVADDLISRPVDDRESLATSAKDEQAERQSPRSPGNHDVDHNEPTQSPGPDNLVNEAQTHSPHEQNTNPDAQNAETVPASDYDTEYLHPVTVEYEGQHISLFPPMEDDDSDTYLLHDTSVADGTLTDLFRECRQVLGNSIGDDNELEIFCEALDLTITEDSIHCMNTSFSQILDVYVTLMHHDGVETPDALFINLTTKPRFSARLDSLYRAASESKGLSEFHLNASPTKESFHGEYQDPETGDEPTTHDQSEEQVAIESFDADHERQENTPDNSHNETTSHNASTDQRSIDGTAGDAHDSAFIVDSLRQQPTSASDLQQDKDEAEESAQLETPADNDEGPEVKDATEPNHEDVVEEPSYGDDLFDYSGSVEKGDDESSGSSTVQGENDPLQSYTAHDDQSDALSQAAELSGEKAADSATSVDVSQGAETVSIEDSSAQTGDDQHGEATFSLDDLQPVADHEFYVGEEGYDQDWDQLGHDESQTAVDENEQKPLTHENEGKDTTEETWDTLDDHLDFDFGDDTAEGDEIADGEVTSAQQSSGTFRVPYDSPEDEDSITYDDDEPEEPAKQAIDTTQARPTGSPLGKRSREDDEDGGEDGGDQELKRLRSH